MDKKISDLGAVTDVLTTDEYVLARSGATNKITADDLAVGLAAISGGGGGGLYDAYAYLRDEKAANTAGGTFTSGAWRTRTLNTEVFDTASFVSLSTNQFTLGTGVYFVLGRAPCFGVNRAQAKIFDITHSADVAIGSSGHAPSGSFIYLWSEVRGRITVTGSTAFELQHQCQTTVATNGLGVEANFGVTEVYSEIVIWREA